MAPHFQAILKSKRRRGMWGITDGLSHFELKAKTMAEEEELRFSFKVVKTKGDKEWHLVVCCSEPIDEIAFGEALISLGQDLISDYEESSAELRNSLN